MLAVVPTRTTTLPMIGAAGAGYGSRVMPPLIDVSGTPAECGAAYGTAASALVRQNIEVYARRFRDQAGMDQAAVRAAGEAFRTSTHTVFPASRPARRARRGRRRGPR